MKAQFINPFVASAIEVLKTECNVNVKRNGKLTLTNDARDSPAALGTTGSTWRQRRIRTPSDFNISCLPTCISN